MGYKKIVLIILMIISIGTSIYFAFFNYIMEFLVLALGSFVALLIGVFTLPIEKDENSSKKEINNETNVNSNSNAVVTGNNNKIKQYVSNDTNENEKLLNKNPQPLLNLHNMIHGFYCARYNIVHMFDTFLTNHVQNKYFDDIVNSREKLFIYLNGLNMNINKFYYLPNDLKDPINKYIDYCEKEKEYWGEKSKKIHYRPVEDLTFDYVDTIFSLTEKHVNSKIKKRKSNMGFVKSF